MKCLKKAPDLKKNDNIFVYLNAKYDQSNPIFIYSKYLKFYNINITTVN